MKGGDDMKPIKRKIIVSLWTALCPMLSLAGPVNVNTADAATISSELQGVGLARAEAIVQYREANGPFKSADDLVAVKGIGARTIELNRNNILLKGQTKKPRK
jgi:competence protein ComEA